MTEYPFAGPIDDPYSFQMAEPVAPEPKLDLPATGWYSTCYLCDTGFDNQRYTGYTIKSTKRNYEIRVHDLCQPKKR